MDTVSAQGVDTATTLTNGNNWISSVTLLFDWIACLAESSMHSNLRKQIQVVQHKQIKKTSSPQ